MTAWALDTDVVIGALDRRDAHHEQAADALLAALAGGGRLLLCAVNYAEALVRPSEHDETLRRAVRAIAALRIEVTAPDAADGRAAARARGLGISLADGFALATAARHDAAVATFDTRVLRAAATLELPIADL